MKKGQAKAIIIVLLIVIAIALILVVVKLNTPTGYAVVSTSGSAVSNQEQQTLSASDFSFQPYWRNTNLDCNSYLAEKQQIARYSQKDQDYIQANNIAKYSRGELSFSFSINKKGAYHCKVQVDNGNQYPLTSIGSNLDRDTTFMGSANVFENHKITFCCAIKYDENLFTNEVCKSQELLKLCAEQI